MGCELGFYEGCATTWLEAIRRWNERGEAATEEAGEGAEGAVAAADTDAAPPAESVERCVRASVVGV